MAKKRPPAVPPPPVAEPAPPAQTRVSTTSRNQTVTITSGTGEGGQPRQTWGDWIRSKFNTIVLIVMFWWLVHMIMLVVTDKDRLADWLMFIAGNINGAWLRDMFGDRAGSRQGDVGTRSKPNASGCCCQCHGATDESKACGCDCHEEHKREEEQPGVQA